MEMDGSATGLFLSYKDLEILLIVSLTINFCVLWSVILPKLCHAVLRVSSRSLRGQEMEENASEIPVCCRRFSTNLVFCVALPACGIVLLTSTDILQNPFFTFGGPFRLVFSIALGHYVFKAAEVLTFRNEIFHYKPLLVHHVVAMATYVVILIFEENTLMGVVMLCVEGSLVFAEREKERFRGEFSFGRESMLRKCATALVFVVATIIKGIVPISMIIIAFLMALNELLRMSYIPLAFFFLSLVFFASVNLWFFRDALTEVSRQFTRLRRPPVIIIPIHNNQKPTPPTTAINNDGLKQLLLSKDGLGTCVNVTENALWGKDELNLSQDAPAILQSESSTPDEMKGQLFL
ncbi:uncharacterized protein LOC111332185 [Stylophora pistillata]|uniref:TLC domain-containing protein n=1 Tax=Stylophora pistillata TaxID=50429 RepID=A0A2B4S4U8_STYPI|nr:uncharacterized protein LOC111332185 [Stylophora pistillata]PFX24073.1 hypothetical protein AWC38_SpisGene11363 [Stylophora pistillata]